jgi:galactokinase
MTGRAPEVLSRAPGRVNLVGEHTDYNGGVVLPLALPHATWVAASARADGRARVRSLQQDGEPLELPSVAACGPGVTPTWGAYAVGVLWTLARAGLPVPGVDLVVDSTVPLGAGLSSSAALECAVGAAVLGLLGRPVTGADADLLVDAAVAAEQEVVGAATGGMDQTVAVHGRAGHALLVDFAADPATRRQVPLSLQERGLALLVTDTRVAHALADDGDSGDDLDGYAARRAECEEAARLLGVPILREATSYAVAGLPPGRARQCATHVVAETDRVGAFVVALERDDRAALGRLLAASHASLRDDMEVSCAELDLAVAAATGAGALGARMTGGGFGGSTVALVEERDLEGVAAAVDAAFRDAGLRRPQHLLAEPADGASWTRV